MSASVVAKGSQLELLNKRSANLVARTEKYSCFLTQIIFFRFYLIRVTR